MTQPAMTCDQFAETLADFLERDVRRKHARRDGDARAGVRRVWSSARRSAHASASTRRICRSSRQAGICGPESPSASRRPSSRYRVKVAR